jgi:hypothetical protein
MSSLNKVRLPGGVELNISEWLHWPVYSTVEFGAADAIDVDAFSYVKGGRVARTATPAQRTATIADTNLVRKAKMNQDEALVVFAITYEIFADVNEVNTSPAEIVAPAPMYSADNLRRLQAETTVELIVGAGIKKAQVEAPFAWIGQGIGTSVEMASGQSASQYGTGGRVSPLNQRRLNLPVVIGGTGQNAAPGNSRVFKLNWRSCLGAVGSATGYQALNQGGNLRWWLDGLKKRPG